MELINLSDGHEVFSYHQDSKGYGLKLQIAVFSEYDQGKNDDDAGLIGSFPHPNEETKNRKIVCRL